MQRPNWTSSNHFYLCLGSLLWVYGTRVFSFGQTFTEQSLDGTKYLIQLYICREADAALDHVNNFRCFLPERNNVEQRLVMLVMGPYQCAKPNYASLYVHCGAQGDQSILPA